MKYGIYLHGDEQPAGFDLCFNYVKEVSGELKEPLPGSHSIVSCFSDNGAAAKQPDLVSVSESGRATRKESRGKLYCDWICLSKKAYAENLLRYLKDLSTNDIAGIHLDSIHFPGEEFCRCSDCLNSWQSSGLEWDSWRQALVSRFVENARAVVDKELSVTLYPDPLHPERFGLDIASLSKHVSFFVVPIYDTSYATSYWVEILAHGFRKRINKPLYLMLYAAGIDEDRLFRVAELIQPDADGIIFAYDVDKSQRVVKRLREGV